MNVLYGLTRPDSGEIVYDGRQVSIAGPQEAIKLGIGMVHQHFMLIPPLTVAENVILGQETAGRGGTINQKLAHETVRRLSREYGLEVPPGARIEDLSVGLQQRVEILKALYRGARLLILDEPTAVLTPQEADQLFEIIRKLKSEGSAIIFITHKLREVMALSDRITVMRRGKLVTTTTPAESGPAELARLMVGRSVLLQVDRGPSKPGAPKLQLTGLVVEDDRHQRAVNGVDLEVRAGEIVGLAGVEGNGQNELVEAVAGIRTLKAGRIQLDGKDVTHSSTHHRLHAGLSHIPADRHKLAAILELSVEDNIVLPDYREPRFARWGVRLFSSIREHANRLIRSFDIRTEAPELPLSSLSGGNQQKLVVARELGSSPSVLLAAQPTRGVDVGSIEFIHRQMVQQRDQGLAVLLVSSELDEILSLSDRVAVMYQGRVVAVLEGDAIERERIGLLMAGGG